MDKSMVVVYILLGILILSNMGVIYLYLKEKKETAKVMKDTTACQMTIESLRKTIQHISEEFYSLDKLIDSRIQAHVNRLNEVIEDTVLQEDAKVDDKILDAMREDIAREIFENPYTKEKSMSIEELEELYPEFKKANMEKNGITGQIPGVIQGDVIHLNRGIQ